MTDDWLIGPVTATAYGWRLERNDGVTIGFTSHDRDVVIDNLLYSSRPGMVPTSIVTSTGLETDGLEIAGSLASDMIRADDLSAGRWDNARLTIFLFDWSDPQAGQRILAVGFLGAVSFSQNGFSAELNGIASALKRPVVPATSPTCRATFCGSGCGLNRRRFTYEAKIVAIAGDRITLLTAPVAVIFPFGSLRWLDGDLCGLRNNILGQNGSELWLSESISAIVPPGTRVELIEGCDKSIATCAGRFNNAINFRGEPYLPGNDALTRYPGAS